MSVKNLEIRAAMKAHGVPQWAVAEELGMSEFKLCRMLRHELPDNDREKILAIISDLAEGNHDGEAAC